MNRAALASLPSIVFAFVALLPLQLQADDSITFYDAAFLPTTLSILVGETVTWQWAAGSHILTSGASSDPADDPGALFEAPIDAEHPEFAYTFNLPGVYSYFDALHETGLVGTVIVTPYSTQVDVVDDAFVDQHIAIFVGDQVHWHWIEGLHSVTSGASSTSPDAGALFNATMSAGQQDFLYVFTEAGIVPYFCIPHELLGMNGTVTVQRLFIRGDTNGDGVVDLADPVTLLSHLFVSSPAPSCLDAADADDSGALDIADAILALDYLFGSTFELPEPFPTEGADRTADSLLCQ